MKLIILTDTQENTESPNLNITRHHLNLDNDVIFPDIKNTGENATITPEGTGIPHYVGLGLSDEGLRHLYNMSDCFVTASTGESFCILPNTKIITDNGTKKIQEVSISNKLLTHTGEFRKINKIFRREYIGSIIKIKCYGSFEEINMTTNHKILVSKKNKRKFNNLEWVESEKIEKGDFVVLPKANKIFNELIFDIKNLSEKYDGDDNNVWYCKKFSIKEKKIKLIKLNRYVNFDKELAKLFGWYLSEGDCANGVTVGFSFNIKEDAYINEVIFLVNKIFRIDKYTLIKIKNKNAKHLIFSSKILSDFFSYFCGKGAKNKHIPKEFLYGDENNLLLLIDRYWKGDGNLRNNFYQATTASEKLAYDLKIGLIRLGKNASVRRNKRKRKYNTEQVYITTEYVVSYLSKRSNHSVKIINKDDNCFFRVKSIEKELYKGEVFNFEIDVDNTYCTSNFIVHNCIPLIEAQACGVPCIMPNNTVATEHIIKPCTGIVADVSRELYVEQLHASVQLVSIPSLTNAMTRMMTEKNKYVQNCLKNAKKYDTKKVMKKWLTFFDKIIEHRKNTLNYKNSIGI